jgi:hypothetical protein
MITMLPASSMRRAISVISASLAAISGRGLSVARLETQFRVSRFG